MLPAAYFIPLLLLVQAILFLAPGLIVCLWLHRKKQFSVLYILVPAGVIGGLIGHAVFWLYILHPLAGEWASTVMLVGGWIAAIHILANSKTRSILKKADFLLPFGLMLAVTLFYNATYMSCQPDALTASCYMDKLPMDNTLPQIFAKNVAEGRATDLIGDWHGSDRGPLQSGIVLAQGVLTDIHIVGPAGYQLLASFLQSLWIPALWAILRLIGLKPQQLALALAICIFTGFLFFNSIYVWPKLLAAAFGLLAFCLLFFEKQRPLHWLIAGLAMGASLLAHTGIAFTLLPMVIAVIVIPRLRPNLKTALLAIGALLCTVVPWMAYQKFYDPPGDRLLKWHIAGVIAVDERPFVKAVVDSYATTPFVDVVYNKLSNFHEIIGKIPPEDHLYGMGRMAQIRDAEFRHMLISFGLLNIGWIALAFKSIRARIKANLDAARLRLVTVIASTGVVLWAFVMFGPSTTIVHQGSYLTILLLLSVLLGIVVQLPKRFKIALLGLQSAYFIVVWVGSILIAAHYIDAIQIMWIVCGFLATIGCLWGIYSTKIQDFTHARNV